MTDRARPFFFVLVAIAAIGAIGAIASVAMRLRTVERTEREARGDPVLQLDPAAAVAIRISTDGRELRLERTATGWLLVAPVKAEADAGAVSRLLAGLAALERRATVAPAGESADRLRPYGLDAPRTSIEVTSQAGDVERLAFGGDTGVDGASFVMATSGEVAMVSSEARAGLEKSLGDLAALAAGTGRRPAAVPPLRARTPPRGG